MRISEFSCEAGIQGLQRFLRETGAALAADANGVK
jgi:hypothetical protein